MRIFTLAATLVAIGLSASVAQAGFALRFDSPLKSAAVGSQLTLDIILEETAGTNFFSGPLPTGPLVGAAFSITNSDSSKASIVSISPNNAFNLNTTNVNPGSADFQFATFGAGVTGTSRTIGTITFNADAIGNTDIQLTLHPLANTNELVFGSILGPGNSTPIDLNTAGIPVTFDVGTLQITAVPEPTTMVLVGLGIAGAGLSRRFRRKSQGTAA